MVDSPTLSGKNHRPPSVLRAPALSLASQAAGVLQLFALLWRHGATNATDTYFYLFNLGNLPTQVLLVGVMYPLLLNDSRLTRRGARVFAVTVPICALIAVGIGTLWLAHNGRLVTELVPVAVLSAVNALFQAFLWFRAVCAEAAGAPQWVSGIALPANVLATIVAALPWNSSTSTVLAMMVGLTTANATLACVALRLRVGADVVRRLPTQSDGVGTGSVWFLAKSSVSYGGLMIIQSLSLILPPATLTLLTVPMKIVASVAATFVNAILPRIVHQTTDSPAQGRSFLKIVAAWLIAAAVVVNIPLGLLFPRYSLIGVVVGLWLMASASSSVSQRLAFRFLPPNASRITILVVPTVVAGVAISATFPGFGLIALLAAYAMVDALSGFLLLLVMRDRLMGSILGLVMLFLAAVWLASIVLDIGP